MATVIIYNPAFIISVLAKCLAFLLSARQLNWSDETDEQGGSVGSPSRPGEVDGGARLARILPSRASHGSVIKIVEAAGLFSLNI